MTAGPANAPLLLWLKLAPLGVLAVAAVVAGGMRWAAGPPRWAATEGPAATSGPERGAAIFRQRCAICHPVDDRSAQGPGLGGVLGRKAASARGFGYSRALRESGLTWDRPTLDRFLTSPPALVPGTVMPMALPVADERRDVVAYLATLQVGGAVPSHGAAPTETASPGDYHGDAPGVRHHVTLAGLPAPFATPSAHNGPSTVDAPAGARPVVPPGFVVSLFARDLQNPRLLRVAPNGDVFVAESTSGQLRVLRTRDGADAPVRTEVFAAGLDKPFGVAFFPPGREPRWLYVANTNSVVRFPYRSGDLRARGAPETVVPSLTKQTGGHWTRDIAFSRDGARMFVSVGSASNVAEDMRVRAPDEIAAWEAGRVEGAAWDDEEDRADVLEFDAEGKGGHVFAAGIRNCVGLTVHPVTGDVWCSCNERDGLGDDLVPDYVTRVKPAAFYGWPWYYLGDHEDPRHAGERPELRGKMTVPDLLLQAHSAPLQTTFYEGTMFPAAYRGSVFASLHGSWNRASRTGPKVVRVPVENGVPTGEYEDFLTGFVVDDANVWGRPVGVAVAHDGALLVSEDAGGTIWRVSYPGAPR